MNTDSPIVIQARNLRKSFADREVVCGIDFDVVRGKCFGFLGPNGAGKTTTLSMIEGVSPMSSGQLEVFGFRVPAEGKQARLKMGIVPQMDNLDPDFTVLENLRMYGRFFGKSGAEFEKQIRDLLAFMQLSERVNDRPDDLSGGMKRRLTIARALVNDPDLIILDEPTTGLDPQVRHVIWGKLRELMSSGKTLLMTSHYMDEAERLCDSLFIMDRGKILETGSPRDIIKKHVESHVVELRGSRHKIDSQIQHLKNLYKEFHGDTLFCYTNEPEKTQSELLNLTDVTLLMRACNLEDVFLRLTGRELRE